MVSINISIGRSGTNDKMYGLRKVAFHLLPRYLLCRYGSTCKPTGFQARFRSSILSKSEARLIDTYEVSDPRLKSKSYLSRHSLVIHIQYEVF